MPLPSKIICGYKDDISTAGERLTDKITPVMNRINVRVRSLSGGATYIAIGNEEEQPRQLTVGDSQDIYIDDVSKIVVITDTGTGCLEWFGS